MLEITVTYGAILIKVNGFCAAEREGARRTSPKKFHLFFRLYNNSLHHPRVRPNPRLDLLSNADRQAEPLTPRQGQLVETLDYAKRRI